ncbi:FAD-dependent monooxygenase [Cryptosporangium phraense]|uniref:FAD-dependent monooxygenase n=1 Tax=Cryptosporangium phraense TaxID=2593070 RepID=UPI00197AFCCE|nr:FAD-dependent monooxygenase [Cryptosporangium phraense]
MFLQYHGVDFVLVERRDGASVLPRSRGVHSRTVEMFRQVGVEEQVQRAAASALARGAFGGAQHGTTVLDSEASDLRGLAGCLGGDDSTTCWPPTAPEARWGRVPTPDNAADRARQLDAGAITRVPHDWLDHDGRQVSTLDLCGPGFTVLAHADGSAWRAAAAAARSDQGLCPATLTSVLRRITGQAPNDRT